MTIGPGGERVPAGMLAPICTISASSNRDVRPLERRFEALVFDWDGTAVPDRSADATRVRELVEELCGMGLYVAVVSGTHVGNVDGQLRARPAGPGWLLLALNRGSEVFVVDGDGPREQWRRHATRDENAALDLAARHTVERLGERGLDTRIVSERLNRRKIDLIPEPAWEDPPKAAIDRLLTAVEARLARAGFAGLPDVVEVAEAAARDAGLDAPRITSDAKHVEIGLTDKADSARFIVSELWRRGVGPRSTLVVGDEVGPLGELPGSDSLLLVPEARGATVVSVGVEPLGVPEGVLHVGGGPDAFVALLEDQLARRRRGEPPLPEHEPAWSLTIEGLDSDAERVNEALLTVADGRLGTRGAPLVAGPHSTATVLAAGVYEGEGPETALLAGPRWHHLVGPARLAGLQRTLELRSGLLHEQAVEPGWRSVRFSSLARPGSVVLRLAGDASAVDERSVLAPPLGRSPTDEGTSADARWMRVASSCGGGVTAAARERSPAGRAAGFDRLGAYATDPDVLPEPEVAVTALSVAERAGFEELLCEHRTAWASRWERADVVIEGDADLQRPLRFALFHLMASVADRDEAAVGARGLTGPAYRGHVFWDSDVFVLPFLAATHPPAARAMLEYRVRRLPRAREAASARGADGARFPWESARTGTDVTPTEGRAFTGEVVPILTGEFEEHIVADVAWAAACYLDWTGDEQFARGPGLDLFVDTARYWASRVRVDEDGFGHIEGVIGPDEYHELVDDNAFTNVMARWNLRRAAAECEARAAGASAEERACWRAIADSLVDGYDAATGVYEQFAGFFELEPLVAAEIFDRRPVAAEAVLGRERASGSQVIKQADVLLLFHLVPDEVEPGSLRPNVEYYEPRTAHGSSLSPPVHAGLFGRLGEWDSALAALRLASHLDLDDLTGTTAGGLHLATMGGLWQAVVYGFAGLRPLAHALSVDPRLPPAWTALDVRVWFRGTPLRVRVEGDQASVVAEGPLAVVVGERREVRDVPPGGLDLRHGRDGWEVRG